MSEKTKRVRRIAGLIQSVVATVLKKEVSDPRLAKATISGIDLAPDYGQAVLFFSLPDPTPHDIKTTEKAFEKATSFFRYHVSQSTELRYTPQLIFKYDASILNAERISALLDDV